MIQSSINYINTKKSCQLIVVPKLTWWTDEFSSPKSTDAKVGPVSFSDILSSIQNNGRRGAAITSWKIIVTKSWLFSVIDSSTFSVS